MSVHVNAADALGSQNDDGQEGAGGELALPVLKKYIAYCRQQCAPRLSDGAERKLCSYYTRMRNPPASNNQAPHQARSIIPITVRQLEALVRA